MPFTVSHAVAVVPLFRWRRLDPLALVVGSMAPDFGYFFHRFALAAHAHSAAGSIRIALPIACCVWLAVRIFAGFLASPLPDPLRLPAKSCLSGRPWRWSMLWWVPLSLVLGIWSHSVLDAFTHERGWFVVRLELLRRPWPVYHVLQHVGSCLGMGILVVLAYREWRLHASGGPLKVEPKLVLLGLALVVSALLAAQPSWNFASRFEGLFQIRAFTFRWIVNSIAIMSCAYLALALGFQLASWRTGRRAKPDY
jgi:hypothetical protein